ncbi:hypothetical protein, partial [Amycolatopsis stemonae]
MRSAVEVITERCVLVGAVALADLGLEAGGAGRVGFGSARRVISRGVTRGNIYSEHAGFLT